jgi:hypothetical protein
METQNIFSDQEITERNIQILLGLGFVKDGQVWSLPNRPDTYVGPTYVSLVFNEDILKIHEDYNWLMFALERIRNWKYTTDSKNQGMRLNEYVLEKFEIKRYGIWISFFQWTSNGWVMPERGNGLLYNYRCVPKNKECSNASSFKEAIWLAISDFYTNYNKIIFEQPKIKNPL